MSKEDLTKHKAAFDLSQDSPRIVLSSFELKKNGTPTNITSNLSVLSRILNSNKRVDVHQELTIDGVDSDNEKVFTINLKLYASFVCNESAEKAMIESFAKLNAPAIVFPFLRASLCSLCLSSAIKQINLPLINFQKFPVQLETIE